MERQCCVDTHGDGVPLSFVPRLCFDRDWNSAIGEGGNANRADTISAAVSEGLFVDHEDVVGSKVECLFKMLF